MADIYIYADETGNLDYAAKDKGGKDYFGFGTVTYARNHGQDMFEGFQLRTQLEKQGVSTKDGFHAYADSWLTRTEVYKKILSQNFRFDITLLAKSNAYDYVKAKGEMHLYKMAWYLHIKAVANFVATKNDTIYMIVGSFGTKERENQARAAIHDVCNQLDMNIIVCIWESRTSWGLQVADYMTWAVQRQLYSKNFHNYETLIDPRVATQFFPWDKS